jgi:hypothetical protein
MEPYHIKQIGQCIWRNSNGLFHIFGRNSSTSVTQQQQQAQQQSSSSSPTAKTPPALESSALDRERDRERDEFDGFPASLARRTDVYQRASFSGPSAAASEWTLLQYRVFDTVPLWYHHRMLEMVADSTHDEHEDDDALDTDFSEFSGVDFSDEFSETQNVAFADGCPSLPSLVPSELSDTLSVLSSCTDLTLVSPASVSEDRFDSGIAMSFGALRIGADLRANDSEDERPDQSQMTEQFPDEFEEFLRRTPKTMSPFESDHTREQFERRVNLDAGHREHCDRVAQKIRERDSVKAAQREAESRQIELQDYVGTAVEYAERVLITAEQDADCEDDFLALQIASDDAFWNSGFFDYGDFERERRAHDERFARLY